MNEDKNIFINRKIENEPFFMAEVEIIIPFHDEQTYVTKLIESIFASVLKNKYLITLVDDFSTNKAFLGQIKEAKIPGVRCLRMSKKSKDLKTAGFGASVNHALNTPWVFKNNLNKSIPYVCILQSDTLTLPNNWLFELGTALETMKNAGIKMISPLTDNPMSDNPLLKADKNEKRDNHVIDDYLPMYCALCNRELFKRVGLFKELPYAGVEVQEFAQRMKNKGFGQGMCGSSWIHHEGGKTLAQYENHPKIQKILRKVKDDFLGIEESPLDIVVGTN